jgi:hypothetical protein
MIAGLVLSLLADVVFESAASMRRAFATEMDRYLTRRGFVGTVPPARTTVR